MNELLKLIVGHLNQLVTIRIALTENMLQDWNLPNLKNAMLINAFAFGNKEHVSDSKDFLFYFFKVFLSV